MEELEHTFTAFDMATEPSVMTALLQDCVTEQATGGQIGGGRSNAGRLAYASWTLCRRSWPDC